MPDTQLTLWIDRKAREVNTTASAVFTKAGMSKATMSKWRSGQSPNPLQLRDVALALGADVLEAFVAAQFIAPGDTTRIVEVDRPLTDLSDEDLLTEVSRRIKGATHDRTEPDADQTTTTEGAEDEAGEVEKTPEQMTSTELSQLSDEDLRTLAESHRIWADYVQTQRSDLASEWDL